MTPKVSVLFNEPKLLKFGASARWTPSALGFSALQRAEIAEISSSTRRGIITHSVSVLFNEPKLLKFAPVRGLRALDGRFSALQRAEIAEILLKQLILR